MDIKSILNDKNTNTKDSDKRSIPVIIKGSITSIIITIIGLLILSLILTYTNVKESYSMPIIMIISAISIIIGSIISSKKMNKKGLINGGLVGLIYIMTIYILSSVFYTNFSLNLYSIITMIISIIAGTVGGVIGVNMR